METESFSDVIRRFLKRKKNIVNFAGAWKNINNEDIKGMKKDIKELRKKQLKIF